MPPGPDRPGRRRPPTIDAGWTRTGVDQHRLLGQDDGRVDVDRKGLTQGVLHLVDDIRVRCDLGRFLPEGRLGQYGRHAVPPRSSRTRLGAKRYLSLPPLTRSSTLSVAGVTREPCWRTGCGGRGRPAWSCLWALSLIHI